MKSTGEVHSTSESTDFKIHYDRACIVCGAETPGERLGEVSEHEYTNTTDLKFPVYRCPSCRLVYLYPRPDSSELKTIYPPDYYSYHMSMNAPVQGTNKKSFVQGLFAKITSNNFKKRILPHLKPAGDGRPLRVLDVGCGVGAQLDFLKNVLPECETHGVEIQEIAVEKARARGHHVHFGRFEDLDLPKDYFDVIVSVHVIEHVARPDQFLEKCLSLLTDDGIALIETPNTDCLDFKLLKGGHWGGYHPPRHWYMFEKRTFDRLAERLGCRIVAHKSYTMSNFWSWTCHSLLLKCAGRRLADLLFPPVKILFGGVRSFVILSFFAVFERVLLALTGKGCSIWLVFGKQQGQL